MVSPKSSSSSMKSFASFSKDDSGESKGKTNMTSLGRSRWGRDSATEFLARVIGMVKVSLPNFMSNSPILVGSRRVFLRDALSRCRSPKCQRQGNREPLQHHRDES